LGVVCAVWPSSTQSACIVVSSLMTLADGSSPKDCYGNIAVVTAELIGPLGTSMTELSRVMTAKVLHIALNKLDIADLLLSSKESNDFRKL